jgi:hypothetical protein
MCHRFGLQPMTIGFGIESEDSRSRPRGKMHIACAELASRFRIAISQELKEVLSPYLEAIGRRMRFADHPRLSHRHAAMG